jgi:hypothetical protein
MTSGCGPISNLGSTDTTAGSSDVTHAPSATADPGGTGSSATLDVTTSPSSSSFTGPMPTTTLDPTCGEFVCERDMLKELECDVFAQDCPDGEKCVPVSTDGGGDWNAARCVPVTGTDLPGDACTSVSVADGLDSCVKGALCWGVDMDGHGTCVAQCLGIPDTLTCPNDGICTLADGDPFVLALCFPHCDPLLQDCKSGSACYPINDDFSCALDASGDTGQANAPCEFINVCKPGLLCAGPEFVGTGCPMGSTGCCTPFCEFPAGACPNPDQQCVQWFDPAMLSEGDPRLDIGFCGVPQ